MTYDSTTYITVRATLYDPATGKANMSDELVWHGGEAAYNCWMTFFIGAKNTRGSQNYVNIATGMYSPFSKFNTPSKVDGLIF